jgi:SAM-dependent MidA family methyltransferase
MSSPLVEHLRQRIRDHGPLSFRDFMEEALYHPQYGYYSSSKNPVGREGDFYTSSDLDPILGTLLARKFAAMAAELQMPADEFTLIELGAGRGLLARDILAAQKFPYQILERSAAMRERQRDILKGQNVEWIDDLPAGLTGCIFSNEFFDALPVHRVIRREGKLRELYIDGNFTEIEGNLQTPMEVGVEEGCIADINLDAREWMRKIAIALRRGFHLAIDYGYLDREFYARPRGTLMCYWRHQVSENPYLRIGEQDITAHVNFSDLIAVGRENSLETTEFSSQMEFLIGQGILDEMEPLAAAGTAASIARLQALKKLILPGSMGERFKVVVQRKVISGV